MVASAHSGRIHRVIVAFGKPLVAVLARFSVLAFGAMIVAFFTYEVLRVLERKLGIRIPCIVPQVQRPPAVQAHLAVFLVACVLALLAKPAFGKLKWEVLVVGVAHQGRSVLRSRRSIEAQRALGSLLGALRSGLMGF